MDDEESILEAYGKLLTIRGYTVVPARDGDEAIAAYREAMEAGSPVDLVIMDLTIPGGKGGKETIGELRTLDPGVLAVVSSGFSHDEILVNYRDYGFTAVIPKPYTLRDLVAMIDDIIARKKSAVSG